MIENINKVRALLTALFSWYPTERGRNMRRRDWWYQGGSPECRASSPGSTRQRPGAARPPPSPRASSTLRASEAHWLSSALLNTYNVNKYLEMHRVDWLAVTIELSSARLIAGTSQLTSWYNEYHHINHHMYHSPSSPPASSQLRMFSRSTCKKAPEICSLQQSYRKEDLLWILLTSKLYTSGHDTTL